jgi:hypothetical protein
MKLILRLKRQKSIFLVLTIWIFSHLIAGPAHAFDKQSEGKISDAVNAGLQHFLGLADPDKKVIFDPRMVAPVLDFVETPKSNEAIYYSNIVRDLTSAYYDFNVHKSLKTIMDYAFNPDIPAIAIMPSSTRLINWAKSDAGQRDFPRVSRYLAENSPPVEFRGRQFVEITPDLNSGAYYGYDAHQVLLLFKYRRSNVFVTVSKQVDVSTVGKKGYVLGSDNDWDYLYTRKTGLTLPALGWVQSYMYDSMGINIYYANEPTAPKVRCAVFKWLRAGWSGINMVQKKHIYRGLKRFGATFKEIVESPSLPPVNTLAGDFARIRGLSRDALRSKMDIYSNILKSRYNSGRRPLNKEASKLFEDQKHWYQMSKDEMESAIIIEYMKYTIGKTRPDDVRELLGLKR